MQNASNLHGIITTLLKAASEEWVEPARQLSVAVFSRSQQTGRRTSLWTFTHGNYHDLKLTDLVMRLLKHRLDFYTQEMMRIDKMQFGFEPGTGTTDSILISTGYRRSKSSPTNCSTLSSLILRKPSIVYKGRFSGGPRGALVPRNVIQGMHPNGVMCRSMISTVGSLALD